MKVTKWIERGEEERRKEEEDGRLEGLNTLRELGAFLLSRGY